MHAGGGQEAAPVTGGVPGEAEKLELAQQQEPPTAEGAQPLPQPRARRWPSLLPFVTPEADQVTQQAPGVASEPGAHLLPNLSLSLLERCLLPQPLMHLSKKGFWCTVAPLPSG